MKERKEKNMASLACLMFHIFAVAAGTDLMSSLKGEDGFCDRCLLTLGWMFRDSWTIGFDAGAPKKDHCESKSSWYDSAVV